MQVSLPLHMIEQGQLLDKYDVDKIHPVFRKSCFHSSSMFDGLCLPFPKQQILDSAKLKEFADDNFKFDENGRKFSKKVENTVEKGEIACSKQFLYFPQSFKKTSTAHS